MAKSSIFFLTILFWLTFLNLNVNGQVAQPSGKIGVNSSPGGIVEEIKSENPASIKGSIYLDDNWLMSNVYFKNGLKQLEIPVKYDLKNQVLKLKYKSKVNIFGEDKVERFEIHRVGEDVEYYVNASEFQGHHTYGFFQIALKDHISLFILAKLNFIKPNYVATHDVGEKEGKYVTEKEIYLARGETVTRLASKKVDFLQFFEEHNESIHQFIKTNKLKFKREEDLLKIIKYYNSLVEQE